MFKKLFSRDLPAAKAYHAASLSAAGNENMAELVRSGDNSTSNNLPSGSETFACGLWNLLKRTLDDAMPVDLIPFNPPMLRRE